MLLNEGVVQVVHSFSVDIHGRVFPERVEFSFNTFSFFSKLKCSHLLVGVVDDVTFVKDDVVFLIAKEPALLQQGAFVFAPVHRCISEYLFHLFALGQVESSQLVVILSYRANPLLDQQGSQFSLISIRRQM